MVAGTPCMCMRTTGTPRSAQRGSSPGSENESGVAFRMPTSATRSSTRGPERVRSTAGPLGAVGRAGLSGRGGRRAPEATVLGPELPEDLVDLAAVDRLALEERLGHLVEHLEVAAQEELRALVGLEQDAAHLGVDLDGGLLGVVDLLREVAAEEDLLFLDRK